MSERLSFHLPQRGNAYQPRATPWEPNLRESVCSEGTPHREGRGRGLSSATYAAFLQNAGFFFGWVPRVGTLGWYAMPRQGMGLDTWLGIGIGNVVGPTVSERLSFHLPQRGNAYQPRASPWETNPRESVCSEGTPHREGRGRGLSSAVMRRSFRTRVSFSGGFPGLAPWAGMRCPVRAWDPTRGWGLVSDTRWVVRYRERGRGPR